MLRGAGAGATPSESFWFEMQLCMRVGPSADDLPPASPCKAVMHVGIRKRKSPQRPTRCIAIHAWCTRRAFATTSTPPYPARGSTSGSPPARHRRPPGEAQKPTARRNAKTRQPNFRYRAGRDVGVGQFDNFVPSKQRPPRSSERGTPRNIVLRLWRVACLASPSCSAPPYR